MAISGQREESWVVLSEQVAARIIQWAASKEQQVAGSEERMELTEEKQKHKLTGRGFRG